MTLSFPPVWKNGPLLTCLHAFVIIINRWLVIGLVDSSSEALIAASASNDSRAWAMERNVTVQSHLGHGCLQTF